MKSMFPGNCKAFTLAEIVIVVGIVALGLVTLTKVFPYGFEVKQRAENYSTMGVLAQDLVEKIKKDGYQRLDKTYPETSPGYGKGSGAFEKYPQLTWQVEWWQTDTPDLRKIRVTVQGKTEKEGLPSKIEIVTYLADRG